MSECPKCGGHMETGFILDSTSGAGNAISANWQEGAPEQSFWTGVKQRGHERRQITTFCCSRCGYLESYAKPVSE